MTTFTNLLTKHRNQLAVKIDVLHKGYHSSKNKNDLNHNFQIIDSIQCIIYIISRDRAVPNKKMNVWNQI